MKHRTVFFLSWFFLIFSCRIEKNSTADLTEKVISENKYVSPDSLQDGFQRGIYFPSCLIRITEEKPFFLVLDSSFFGRNYLLAGDREEYYRKAIKQLPEKVIRIHLLAWGILPVQELMNFDGKIFTLATYISPEQDPDNDKVIVKLVRVMPDRLAGVPLLTEVHVYPGSGKTEICDLDGKCEWVTRK